MGFSFKGDAQCEAPTVLDVLAAPSNAFLHGGSRRAEPDGIRQTTGRDVGRTAELAAAWTGGES